MPHFSTSVDPVGIFSMVVFSDFLSLYWMFMGNNASKDSIKIFTKYIQNI